jgi:hypothetical protein
MMLTNYPIDRELVAQRQRKRLEYAERTRRSRRIRKSDPSRSATAPWSFTSWLLGRTTQRRAGKARTGAPSSVAPTPTR